MSTTRTARCRRLLAGAIVALAALPAAASSHREAPLVAEMPKVDATDFYLFRSYEPGRESTVTLIANYLPLQDSYGGPNYFTLDPDAFYRIHLDRQGDGVEDLTFQLRFRQGLRHLAVPVGDKTIEVPLANLGPVAQKVDGDQNVVETFTLQVLRGRVDGPGTGGFATNLADGGTLFRKPMDNVGEKSIPDYAAYAGQFVQAFSIPGCAGSGRVFAGQRRESFAVNLGEIFDLVNLENPLGDRDAIENEIGDKNVTTIALEVPIGCLVGNAGPVVGGWTSAWLPRTRSFRSRPSFAQPELKSAELAQVSRLGMPLVNEVVIGLTDKNRFNASRPADDAQFADYVTNPTLPELLEILFGVSAPDHFPRTDLVAAFLTGVPGLNQLGGPAEMLRLDTSTAPVARAAQNNLGVIGGDAAGFPNGRRPGDDVVDIELRVAMGLLCHAFPGAFCEPADAPSGDLPYTDGTLQDASQFDAAFPYLTTPIPGSPHDANDGE
jgi:hypothetical protein